MNQLKTVGAQLRQTKMEILSNSSDTIKNLVLRDINNIIQNSSPNVLQEKNNLETQYQQLIQQCV